MLFQDYNIGKNWRKEYSHFYNETAEQNWAPILEISRQFKINKNRKSDVMRRQFPLRPSSAKTVHRCQGDTVDRIVIEFPARRSEHMHYVALSRVKNLSGLHILSLNENKITVSKKVEDEMKRLRTKAPLILCALFVQEIIHTTKNTISNVISLHLHFKDVACDYSVKASDISIFVETTLCNRDHDDEIVIMMFFLAQLKLTFF